MASETTKSIACDTGNDIPPVIDLSMPEDELVEQVKTACHRWGFFQITGHCVDEPLRNRFESAMRAFFALPDEDKMKCERSAANARGFVREEMTKSGSLTYSRLSVSLSRYYVSLSVFPAI